MARRKTLWFRVAASGLTIALIAATLVLVGARLAESDPALPPTPTPPDVPSPAPPDPDTIVLPTNPPLPSPTISPPKTITIKGKEVQLPAGMTFGPPAHNEVGAGLEGSIVIAYRPAPGPSASSWLILDGFGTIIFSHIVPQDMAAFQGVLDAAGPPLAPVITIGGKEIQLAPGMRVDKNLLSEPGKTVWTISYYPIPGRTQGPDSGIVIAEDGTIVIEHIQPGDEALFQDLLDAAKSAE